MVVQAGPRGACSTASRSGRGERCATIERTGREALAEMRRLLGVLREDGDGRELAPQPGLSQLDGAGRAGVRRPACRSSCAVDGEPRALPPGVDLSAYRIVQEALTNALKHAGPGARARARALRAPRSWRSRSSTTAPAAPPATAAPATA